MLIHPYSGSSWCDFELVTFSEHRLPEKVVASRKDWRKEPLERNIGKTALEVTRIPGGKMGFEMYVKL